ncbi:MAG: aminoacyl-histidine dipeptidase [Cellulosilyticaceae bacterium]
MRKVKDMTRVLGNLQPEKVFYYFEEISRIPRGSGNEKAISDYMVEFAKKHNLWVKQDEVNNIYIKKPATKGYENAPTVILQGHLDMVCEKNKETDFDFEVQGLDLYTDGDFIKARGTTLGADNGIAIAYQMAVLADDTLVHPAIEALMTTAEETGMDGVANLHPEYLEGKILLNLDTDDEGEFLVSCAGGARAHLIIEDQWNKVSKEECAYRILINGLIGGHSGAEIHHERANANVLMGRVLELLREKVAYEISEVSGGTKDNVITRECEVVIVTEANQYNAIAEVVEEMKANFSEEYAVQDAGICIAVSEVKAEKKLTKVATKQLIDVLLLLPNGISGMSHQISGLVESSMNIGVVQSGEDGIHVTLSIRSSMPSRKMEIVRKITVLSRILEIKCEVGAFYPAWVYEKDSEIRGIAIETYKQMYNEEPKIRAIHAGLECGFISEKLPGVDMIAFGPNVRAIHSPEERASISSMQRVYTYLVELLKNIKA